MFSATLCSCSFLMLHTPFLPPRCLLRLLSMGYSIQEVADAAVETHMNRLQLAQSLQNRKWDSFNSIGEHLRRSLVSSSSKKGSQQSL